MAICYILQSKSLGKFYVGSTEHNNLENRIAQHNSKYYGTGKFTSTTEDWVEFLRVECETIKQARGMEAYIKRMKSRVYIENLKRYPELVNKLKSKFSDW